MLHTLLETQERSGTLRRRAAATARVPASEPDERGDVGRARRRRKRHLVPSISVDWGAVAFATIVSSLGLIGHYFGHRHGLGLGLMTGNVLHHVLLHRSRGGGAADNAKLYRPKFGAEVLGYDIYDCPPTIPREYPRTWNADELLRNWNPNDATTIPPKHREVYQGLCVFDYETQRDIAKAYRDADMPFVMRGDPRVVSVSERWSEPNYLVERLSNQLIYTERSPNNHVKFYRIDSDTHIEGWTRPPNDIVMMSFEEWETLALLREATVLNSKEAMEQAVNLRDTYGIGKEKDDEEYDHVYYPEDDTVDVARDLDTMNEKTKKWYYLRLNGWVEDADTKRIDRFLFDELSFFDPRKKDEGSEFYLFPPEEQNGINCRFGMRGVVAEAHYDGARNMIAVLAGERRYILGHPDQCRKMALHPWGHPSARHSFDWSNPAEWEVHPEFGGAQLSEVVLEAGDVLYLPTSWFHYIINLSKNVQCNSASGKNSENDHYLDECGFG